MSGTIKKRISCLLVIAVCIVVAIMGALTYPFADDLKYWYFNPDLLERIGVTNPLPDLGWIFSDPYLHSNGRLATPLYDIVVGIIPRWGIGIIEGICVAFICLLMTKLSLFSHNPSTHPFSTRPTSTSQAIAISLTALLVLIGLPWHDNLFLASFYIPYLTAMVFLLTGTLILLRLFFNSSLPKSYILAGCICMLLGGMWHEGNALCVFGGIAILWLCASNKARKSMLPIIVFFCIGIAFVILAPATSHRASGMGINLNPTNWFQPYTLTKGVWLWPHLVLPFIYLAMVLFILIASRNEIKPRITHFSFRDWLVNGVRLTPFSSVQLVCTTVTATNLAMGLFFNMPRAAIPGIVFSAAGIVSLATVYLSRNTKTSHLTAIWAITTFTTFSFLVINGACNVPVQIQVGKEQRKVEEMLGLSQDGVVFFDAVKIPHSNHYPWQWAHNSYFIEYVSLHFLKTHPSNRRQLALRLVPTALRNIPGDVAVEGITLIGENFVSDREPEYTDPADAGRREVIYEDEYPYLKINTLVRTESGKEETRFFEVIPFTTSKATESERDLFYLRPVWRSHSEISDPPVEILSVSPAKYW